MIPVILSSDQSMNETSPAIQVFSEEMYEISTKVKGIHGKNFIAYFGVSLLDKSEKLIERKVRWLNDFSGILKDFSIAFKIPDNCKFIKIIYRINCESPNMADCKFEILPINEIKIVTIQKSMEDYDLLSHYYLPKSKELTHEEEFILEKNLVWIFGSPRSGTTWLGTQLLSHNTYVLNEPLIGKHLGMIDCDIKDNKREIERFGFTKDYFFSYRYKETWEFYFRKMILNRIFSQFNDINKKIIIKEPNGTIGADIIIRLLPRSKIIILLRDGRDVIDSILDARAINSWGTEFDVITVNAHTRVDMIQREAKIWVKTIEILLHMDKILPDENKIRIKYEELLNCTFENLKKIYFFLGINISEETLRELVEKFRFEKIHASKKGKGKFYRSAKINGWKDSFSFEEQELMNSIMNKQLKELGYIINGK